MARGRRTVRNAFVITAVLASGLGGVAATAVAPPPAAASAPGPFPAATPFRSDGVLASSPATVSPASTGAVAIVAGTDGGLWWSSQTRGWLPLGAPRPGLLGDPAAVSWADGRIDVFVEGADRKLWQRFSDCDGCRWSAWLKPLGDQGVLASAPTATSWGPGRIDVFVLGVDGAVYQAYWSVGHWNGWLSRGTPPAGVSDGARPGAASWGPGRVDVFVRGADDRLWQTFWTGTGWSGWVQPPGTEDGVLASAPSPSPWGAGHLDPRPRLTVFVTGTDGLGYQTTWDGTWSGWAAVGDPSDVVVGAPGAPTTEQGDTYALARGRDNRCDEYPAALLPPSRVAAAAAYASGRAGTAGFTLVDTVSDHLYSGGAAGAPIRTASVVKVPIAMTLVSQAAAAGRDLTPTEHDDLTAMITQSDNDAASALWDELDGDNVMALMHALGATATAEDPGGAWGFTVTTSRDLAAVLAGLAEGVLGPSGTDLILSLMRQVEPSQAWGIGAAVPGAAVKNGWYPDPTDWRVNCLGVVAGGRYALAVMTEYPIALGQAYGEATCQQVAALLLPGVAAARLTPPAATTAVPALSGIGMTVDGG